MTVAAVLLVEFKCVTNFLRTSNQELWATKSFYGHQFNHTQKKLGHHWCIIINRFKTLMKSTVILFFNG